MLRHLLRSKSPSDIVRRTRTLVEWVGPTPTRMARLLDAFVELLSRYNAPATFPVPALTLRRNPKVFRALTNGPARIELTVHGYRHHDLSMLPAAAQIAELHQAQAVFRAAEIEFSGFRAPYLRWNDALLTSLAAAGFAYDSSHSVLWPVVDLSVCAPAQAAAVRVLLDFCRPRAAATAPVLPSWSGGLLELPVSFPDDEMLVERLGLSDGGQQAELWLAAFQKCYDRGEMFVLQLHPERFFLCAEALEAVLARARGLQPAVWLATLAEIATWWQERAACRVTVTPAGAGQWWVHAEGPARAVLQVRAGPASYRPVPDRDFILAADACPCVGVSPAASPGLAQYLASEGYAVAVTDQPDECAVFLAQTSFTDEDALAVLARVEATSGPLVRFARWPASAQSVLAITGDIESLTVWDYALRLMGA